MQNGMRVGRSGMLLSCVGVVLALASWKVETPVSTLGIVVGLLAVLVGAFPFAIGWGQSRQGSAFLRAVSEPNATRALLLDLKPLAGNRRSLALLLNDGKRQTLAVTNEQAHTILEVAKAFSPAAEVGEHEAAQRAVAALSVSASAQA